MACHVLTRGPRRRPAPRGAAAAAAAAAADGAPYDVDASPELGPWALRLGLSAPAATLRYSPHSSSAHLVGSLLSGTSGRSSSAICFLAPDRSTRVKADSIRARYPATVHFLRSYIRSTSLGPPRRDASMYCSTVRACGMRRASLDTRRTSNAMTDARR